MTLLFLLCLHVPDVVQTGPPAPVTLSPTVLPGILTVASESLLSSLEITSANTPPNVTIEP
jgi:hypothetical protein